jgi:hypothetical protein
MFSYSPETVCEVHPEIVGTKYKGERQPYHGARISQRMDSESQENGKTDAVFARRGGRT